MLNLLMFIASLTQFYTETYHILLHFHEAPEDVQANLPFLGRIHHLSALECGYDGRVVAEDLELSGCTRYKDTLNRSIVFNLLGRNYSKLQHNVQCSMKIIPLQPRAAS